MSTRSSIQTTLDSVAEMANRPVDKYVLWAVFGLLLFGVVAVYSAGSFLAETRMGGSTEQLLLKHVIRAGLALGGIWLFSMIDYRVWAQYSRLFLIGTLILLALTQVIGVGWGGASRWIQVGGVSFQPSGAARLALVIHVAVLLARKQKYVKNLARSFAPVLFWIIVTAGLIGIEDLSSAALLVAVGLIMCFVGRVSMLQLGGLVAIGLILAGGFLISSPERAARLEAYTGLDLFDNTESEQVFSQQYEGYQAHQARIAVARGGLFGVGPGKSIQRNFIPASYNDFIFAIIAEEYGLLGSFILLGLFAVLLFRGFMRIARNAPDPFGLFLAVGVTATLVIYGLVNAGVASGLLPVTGLPMPLVSYGGTSMVVNGILIGMLLNISRQIQT